MKNFKSIVIVLMLSLFIISCGDSAADKRRKDSLYEDSIKQVNAFAKQDSLMQDSVSKANSGTTLNMIDAKGLRQGYWKIYGRMEPTPGYADDAIVREGSYVDGKEEGKWLDHSPDQNMMVETYYKNGLIDPSYKANASNKDTSLNYVDANGKRQGYWEITGAMAKDSHYRPDAIVESGKYVDGEKDGLWTTYNPDGSVMKTISIKNRKK